MNTSIKGQRFRREECVYWGCTTFTGYDRLDRPTMMFRHQFYWRRNGVWLIWNTAVRVNAKVNSDCEFSFTPLEHGAMTRSRKDPELQTIRDEPELRVTRGKIYNAIAES